MRISTCVDQVAFYSAPSWAPQYGAYVLKRLEADIFPQIGHRPIATGKAERSPAGDLRGALKPVKYGHAALEAKDKEYAYLHMEFNLYDSAGNQAGSTIANVNNLEPNGA